MNYRLPTMRRLLAPLLALGVVMFVSTQARADNYACMFYFSSYGDTFYLPNNLAPTGDSWIMQGQTPWYSAGGLLPNWWGKPLWAATHGDGTIKNNYRFYFNADPTQTNNALLDWHADLLTRMGIDFVVLDFTNGAADYNNGPTYVTATKALCNRWQARMAAGLPTPKIVFFVYNEQTLNDVQNIYFSKYTPNLFFNYLGKKLVLVARPNMTLGNGDPAQPPIPSTGAFANYTCRHAWALDTTGSCWQFKENASTPPAAFMFNGAPEQMCAPVSCGGTSDGTNLLPGSQGRQNGAFFNTYMAAAQQTQPTFTFLHSWNEWNAGNIGTQDKPEFIDQWLEEWSSDIEPMSGGHGWQYYDLAAQQVARLKNNFPVTSGQSYTLSNENSGLDLDVPNGTTIAGTQLQQWPADGAGAQLWKFTDLKDGYWTITNAVTGLSLDDANSGIADGAMVDQSSSSTGSGPQWSLRPAGDGSWKIVNRLNSLCVGITGGSTARGAKAILWDDNGKTDHDWYMTPPIPDGTYEIVATNTGNCLDITGLTDGSLAQLHPYAGSPNQKWSVHNLGNGNFSIRNANGRSVDCAGCSPSNGTNVQLSEYSGGACQQWTITPLADGTYKIATVNAKVDGVHDVLDGFGCSGAAGAQVGLWTWDNGGCQQSWRLVNLAPSAPTALKASLASKPTGHRKSIAPVGGVERHAGVDKLGAL